MIAAATRKISGGFRNELVAVQVSDGSEKVIGSQKWLALGGFAWLADGSGLVISALDQTPGSRQLQIWQLTSPKQLTKFTADQIFSFDWSRDGKTMACSRGVVTTDVVLIKDNGREPKE
ncbi:MAG: hypothetical protein AABO57_00750 [Acidobacteriota bacterium]